MSIFSRSIFSRYRYLSLNLSLMMPALLGAGLVAGCKQPVQQPARVVQKGPEIKEAPATPIAEKKAELGDDTWNPEWDAYIEKALPADMLSTRAGQDVRRYCPRFNQIGEADKRAFWAYFFQALAGAEAGLKPTTDVRHTEPEVAVKDDVTKRMVRSEGLLQLTYMDAKRYDCDFDWDADKTMKVKDPEKSILQPKNNLECGVKIMDNQLMTLRKPLLSSSSYWSTLRPGTKSFRVFAKQMANVPEVCRVDPAMREAKVRKGRTSAAPSVAAASPTPGDR